MTESEEVISLTTALILLTSISAIASCISAFIACQKVSAFYKHIRQMQDIYLDNMDELYELRERDKMYHRIFQETEKR